MARIAPGLARDADERQRSRLTALQDSYKDACRREAEAGGPGSLFDPNHPQMRAIERAGEQARALPSGSVSLADNISLEA